MKLTLLFILIATFQINANVFSQNSPIRLSSRNVTIGSVIEAIEEQTQYKVLYKTGEFNTQQAVNLNSGDQTVGTALSAIFSGSNLAYKILDKIIVIAPLADIKASTEQAEQPVTGTVTDQAGATLPGVSVVVKGTSIGTTTDANGKYSLVVPAAATTLVFTSVGQKPIEVAINGKAVINVTMELQSVKLDELIVVGYGTQKKVDLTGAVSQVKMKDVLGDRPVMNTTSALQGFIPGLQITRSSTPGQNSNSVNIRGTLSINGGSPLILVDNSPGDLSMLNPDDIDNISVLKDAASSAIYGARAADGVILITTKHPKSGARFQLEYNTFYGFEKSINKPQQASLTNYLQAYIDAGFTNTYWSNSQNMTKWLGYVKDYKINPQNYTTIGDGIYLDGTVPYYLHEKDLYNDFLTTGYTSTHNLSASGGTETIRYRISAGYNDENGPLITNKDFYKRLNTSAFISADVNKWFTQEINMRYTQGTKRMYVDEVGGLYTLRLISYYPEGNMPASLSLNGKDTPLFTPKNIILNSNTYKSVTENPRVLFKSILKPTKDLNLNFEYTYDKNSNNYDYYSGQWTYTTIQMGALKAPSTDYYLKNRSFTAQNVMNVYGNYTKSFGNHHLTAMAGFNQEDYHYENVTNRAESQAVLSTPSFGGATGVTLDNDTYSEYSSRSGFYRLNYNFKDKYLLETNGRYDGSSKFPKASRFGFFPSVSAGWQLGKEGFMSFAQKYVNEIKLRGSYGSIGNQAIDPYQYSPAMSIAKSNVWADQSKLVTVIGLPGLVSSNFTWETVTTLDFGTDIAAFNNRFQATFDWYSRKTTDMITNGVVQLPATVGASAPVQNTASMRTNGLELAANWTDKIGKLGYHIGLNLFDRVSEITAYYNNATGLINSYYVGRKIGEIWGYKADGYYSVDDFSNTTLWTLNTGVPTIQGYNVKPGDVKFKNLHDQTNSTNQIDPGTSTITDPGDLSIIGNTDPRYQFGANLGVNYGGFDLGVMVQGVGKRDYWLGGQSIFPFAGSGATDAVFQPLYSNQTDYWKPISTTVGDPNYYVPANPNAKLYRIYNQMENVGSNTRVSDKFLQNASYLRIKNVTLSYTFPKAWMNKIQVQQFRLFASVENLATFTSLPKGFDPESLSWSYPFYRTVSFGANISF